MIFQAALLLSATAPGRVFGLDGQTLFDIGVQLFNACFLAVVLTFILYKPVQKFMRVRADKISGQLSDAEEKMAQAYGKKAEYEKKLGEIEEERLRVLESARLDAAEHRRNILEEAKSEADEIRRRAHVSTEAERARLKEETRIYIIEVSSLMAEKIVTRSIDQSDQDRLFNETLRELEEAAWTN